jgi:nicotinate phosphoribosyltransferase
MWHLREKLDEAGFPNVRLVASSGFTVKKCQVFAIANAPVNNIGTGSYLPENWLDTYTTADIVSYNGKHRVKLGREFLLEKL